MTGHGQDTVVVGDRRTDREVWFFHSQPIDQHIGLTAA